MNETPPEKWFSIFGLVILAKTDFLAGAAFVISVITALISITAAGYQFYGFVRGARLELYPPDTGYIFFEMYANGIVATRVAGQITVTNSGDTGQNGVLGDVSVEIQVGSKKFNEHWFSFASISRKDTKLVIEPKESAHSVVVNGGSAVSQVVTFSSIARDCNPEGKGEAKCDGGADFVSDTDFLKALSPGQSLGLTFSASVPGKTHPLQARCAILITQDLITILAANDWYAARCYKK
jgi:hypothetical protein